MPKIIDTSGPEWISDPPKDNHLYWMHEPGDDSIAIVKFVMVDAYADAFNGILFIDEIKPGTKWAKVQDPPGCSK